MYIPTNMRQFSSSPGAFLGQRYGHPYTDAFGAAQRRRMWPRTEMTSPNALPRAVTRKTLFTDEHPAYPRAFSRIPSFPVNHVDRQVRKENSDHLRETSSSPNTPAHSWQVWPSPASPSLPHPPQGPREQAWGTSIGVKPLSNPSILVYFACRPPLSGVFDVHEDIIPPMR
jgi:hypothetical protein